MRIIRDINILSLLCEAGIRVALVLVTMKTIKIITKTFALLLTLSLFVACDNKKNNNQTVNATAGFQYLNGTCVSRANNQQVDITYCQNYGVNQTNNGYSYINGLCVSTYTNQQVDPMLCQNNSLYNNGYGTQMQCNGTFWVWSGYNWSQVQCFGTNCSGQTVYPSGATSQAQAIRCL